MTYPMCYAEIEGWFFSKTIYDHAVQMFPQGVFVEIGAWLGRSTAYLAWKIQNLPIKLYLVDTWRGSFGADQRSDQLHRPIMEVSQGDVFPLFLENMEKCGVLQSLTPLRMQSTEAAKQFADLSIDFCFLDAAHDYDSVKADLAAWFPKVRHGGIFAGDDYGVGWPGVDRAVNEFFTTIGRVTTLGTRTWVFHKIDGKHIRTGG